MLNTFSRRPWATRVALVAATSSLAGAFIALGIPSDDVHAVENAAVGVIGALVALGILRDGEKETTPIDTPVGRDGKALVPADYMTLGEQPED